MLSDNPVEQSTAFIIAWDFDGCITTGHGTWPEPAPIRVCMPPLIKFLNRIGIINGLWTCREGHSLTLAQSACGDADIPIHFVNDTYHLSPFEYKSRKIYAHIYVDDRGIGWPCDCAKYDTMSLGEILLDQIIGALNYETVGMINSLLGEDKMVRIFYPEIAQKGGLTDSEYEQIENHLYRRG